MKKLVIVSAVLVMVFSACKKQEAPTEEVNSPTEYYEKDPLIKECYLGVLGKDSIKAELNILEKDVRSGTLAYNFFEKDKNDGHVSGYIEGDTIFLTYNFMSEGKMSAREVAFLRIDNSLVEGFGDVTTDKDGKVIFKDKKKLSFDSKVILAETDCK